MSGLKLIPASAGGGWQRRYCEHPPSVMLGIKFQASAFWVGGCLHPLFYIALSGRVWARGSAGRAPRSHRGGRGFESLRVHHIINPQKCGFFLYSCWFSAFLVFANLAVSCGIFAYVWHSNGTVKCPLRNWRGYLFTTPSLTLRVPRTKGAFALCLRLERPYR